MQNREIICPNSTVMSDLLCPYHGVAPLVFFVASPPCMTDICEYGSAFPPVMTIDTGMSFHLKNPFIILSAVPLTTILVGFIDIELVLKFVI